MASKKKYALRVEDAERLIWEAAVCTVDQTHEIRAQREQLLNILAQPGRIVTQPDRDESRALRMYLDAMRLEYGSCRTELVEDVDARAVLDGIVASLMRDAHERDFPEGGLMRAREDARIQSEASGDE